jgi:hypothetical protein
VSAVNELDKVRRGNPFLGANFGVVEEPVAYAKFKINRRGRERKQLLPVTLIHSGQSRGGGTTTGLKLYRNGIL